MARSEVDLLQGENAGLVKLDISKAEERRYADTLSICAQH